jgi:hypothetical protein
MKNNTLTKQEIKEVRELYKPMELGSPSRKDLLDFLSQKKEQWVKEERERIGKMIEEEYPVHEDYKNLFNEANIAMKQFYEKLEDICPHGFKFKKCTRGCFVHLVEKFAQKNTQRE